MNEIERKYLVNSVPDRIESHLHQEILQGYISVGDDGTEVRLRRKGDGYYETVKRGAGVSRVELEIELSGDQFNALWPATGERRVEKVRYELPYEDHVIELDVYRGRLSGLVTAEVEFRSLEESRRFTAPSWFGREVTEDQRYKNRNLALHGFPST